MSHSTKLINNPVKPLIVQSQQFSYRLILVKHCGVTFSLSQSTEFVGSHEEPMLLITSSITNPKVSFPSSSASSMEAAIFKDSTNCTKNGERPFTNPQYTRFNECERIISHKGVYFCFIYLNFYIWKET